MPPLSVTVAAIAARRARCRSWPSASRCHCRCREAGERVNHGRIVAGGPGEGAAAGVADAEGLGRGVGATLRGGKGERGRTRADGRGDGSCGDGERHGHSDRRSPGGAESSLRRYSYRRQGAGRSRQRDCAVAGARGRREGQPGRIVAA